MVGTGKILLSITLIVTLNSCLENKSHNNKKYDFQASHIDSISNEILNKTNLSDYKNIRVDTRARIGKDKYMISEYYSNSNGYYFAYFSDSGVIIIDSFLLDSGGWITIPEINSIVSQMNELKILSFACDSLNNMIFSRDDLYSYQFGILNNPDNILRGYRAKLVQGNRYELIKQY